MFAPGRILQVGGGNADAASRNASIIDINGGTPQVSALPQAQFGRHWGNATVMADGRVFVSGGSAVNNAATGVAYTSEIFNPAGEDSWSTGPTATRMRLYHSVSLLLPDATVITMGGGTPGPETNLNAEIYYPPYLFDSSGNPATRPTITTATAFADPGTSLNIETPDAATVQRVSLVKLGSVTHSVDMDQRFLNLPFTRTGGTLQATLPANVNQTPPGYYMIFVINGAGVPSEAKIVRLDVAGTNPPPPPPTTTTTTSTTSTTTTTQPPTTTSTRRRRRLRPRRRRPQPARPRRRLRRLPRRRRTSWPTVASRPTRSRVTERRSRSPTSRSWTNTGRRDQGLAHSRRSRSRGPPTSRSIAPAVHDRIEQVVPTQAGVTYQLQVRAVTATRRGVE